MVIAIGMGILVAITLQTNTVTKNVLAMESHYCYECQRKHRYPSSSLP
jgi:hypothetical protein